MNSFRRNPISGTIRTPVTVDFSKGIEVGSHIKLNGDLLVTGSTILQDRVAINGELNCEDVIRARAFYVISDERKKRNIVDLDQKVVDRVVKSIRPVSYTFPDCQEETFGLIAQDMERIVKKSHSIVKRDTDGLSLDYTQLIPILLAKIQAMEVKIQSLQTTPK